MESDALPYVLFLLLIELAFGASLVMTAVDLRGQVTQGFVRTTTIMLPILYGLALWLALSLEGEAVEGYRLDTGPRAAVPVLVGNHDGAQCRPERLLVLRAGAHGPGGGGSRWRWWGSRR